MSWSQGTEKAGYRVTIERSPDILKLQLWGLWDMALAEQYRADMLAAMRSLEGKKWDVVADIIDFPAQRQDVAQVHVDLMSTAGRLGMRRGVSVVSRALTQLQIRRLAAEAGRRASFFQDEAEARRALATMSTEDG